VGLKLDRWLGLKGIGVTVMTLLGVVGGGNVVYRQITEVLSQDRKDDTEGPPED
jgi:F0F1-type ATP synthase assembly protein I